MPGAKTTTSLQPQQGRQLLRDEKKISSLENELLSKTGKENSSAYNDETHVEGAKVLRLSDIVRQQSIKMLHNLIQEENDDKDIEGNEERQLRRQQSFHRAVFLLHRVGSSLASEACSGSLSIATKVSNGTGCERLGESFSSEVTTKTKTRGSKRWEHRRGSIISTLEDECLRSTTGAIASRRGSIISTLENECLRSTTGAIAASAQSHEGLVNNDNVGKEETGKLRKRLSATLLGLSVETCEQKNGNEAEPTGLKDAKEISTASDGNCNLAAMNAIIDRVLKDKAEMERKMAMRGRRNSVELCPGSTTSSGEGCSTESNATLDPDEFLWDSHDFAHRLGSDKSLPYHSMSTVSDSIRALDLEESVRRKVPDQVLRRKLSSGRIYIKILEDWNERRDQELLAVKARPVCDREGEKKCHDRSIESATEYLWSDRSLGHTNSTRLHGSKGSCCREAGSGRYFSQHNASSSIRALDLNMEGTAKRILIAASGRRKLVAEGGADC